MKKDLLELKIRVEKMEGSSIKDMCLITIKHCLKIIDKRKGGYENLVLTDKAYIDSMYKSILSIIEDSESFDNMVDKVIETENNSNSKETREEKDTEKSFEKIEKSFEKIDGILDEIDKVTEEAKENNNSMKDDLNDLEDATDEVNEAAEDLANDENKESKIKKFGKKALDIVISVVSSPFRAAKKVFNFIFKRNKETITA